VGCSCQNRPKTEAERPPRPPGASISPQFPPVAQLHDKNTIYIKKGACPDFRSESPLWQNSAKMAKGAHAAPPPLIFSHSLALNDMYMLCMVGSINGASKWAEMLIGHAWGGPVVGTT